MTALRHASSFLAAALVAVLALLAGCSSGPSCAERGGHVVSDGYVTQFMPITVGVPICTKIGSVQSCTPAPTVLFPRQVEETHCEVPPALEGRR